MEKMLEAKPTILLLIRKTKAGLGWCVLLAAASPLLGTYAAPVEEGRYAYAKVFVEGTGVNHEYAYMRDVYLDVVAIPAKTVVEQDSGILFTDVSYKKSLSEIQVRALEFVEPHVKELGFEKVSDYQVFIYPGDKGKVHLDRATVEKFRADSFDIPSNLSGPKAELHGVWIGGEPEQADTKPTSTDKKAEMPENSPKIDSAPTLEPTKKSTSTADAAQTKAAAKKKKALAFAKKQAAETRTQTKLKTEGKVVKEMIFGDSLQERQAMTWCGRIVPQFLKSMETSNNKLISMGSCSCKPGGESGSPQKEFRCGFPVTYRVLTNNVK